MATIPTTTENSTNIPTQSCASFGSYPNPLHVTAADRAVFHPVVKFPVPPTVLDLTRPKDEANTLGMATAEQRHAVAAGRPLSDVVPQPALYPRMHPGQHTAAAYTIGRYDEPRVGLYASDHFDNLQNSIESYAGRRNVHVGIDLGGPVGTPVHAFTAGFVHAVGVK